MCRLCVIGLLPTHAAFKPTPAVTAVDFNVGKQNRADAKVSGKRKRVISHLKHLRCDLNLFIYFFLLVSFLVCKLSSRVWSGVTGKMPCDMHIFTKSFVVFFLLFVLCSGVAL